MVQHIGTRIHIHTEGNKYSKLIDEQIDATNIEGRRNMFDKVR